jgi:hypothetical protein
VKKSRKENFCPNDIEKKKIPVIEIKPIDFSFKVDSYLVLHKKKHQNWENNRKKV